MPIDSELWKQRYPTLAGILDDEPNIPKRNVFARNISAGGTWNHIHEGTQQYQTVEDNLVFDDNPDWVGSSRTTTASLSALSSRTQGRRKDRLPTDPRGEHRPYADSDGELAGEADREGGGVAGLTWWRRDPIRAVRLVRWNRV